MNRLPAAEPAICQGGWMIEPLEFFNADQRISLLLKLHLLLSFDRTKRHSEEPRLRRTPCAGARSK